MKGKKRQLHRSFRTQGFGDKMFDIVNYGLLGLIALCVLYPLYFIIIASFSDPVAINNGRVGFWPVGFNTTGYEKIFENMKIWRSYSNTIFYTVAGTGINIVLTMMLAYPLSRKKFFAKTPLMIFVMFTMYFQGGLIPTYLWINDLNLYNTPWVMVLLPAINVFNLIIAINFIKSNIPEELYEAAAIDGCSHIKFFARIVLPLSKTIIVVLVLYYGVAHWNEFMNGLIYLRDEGLYPLQLTLRNILLQNQASGLGDVDSIIEQQKAAELIKYGVIIVSTLPVLVIYPFLQKHFEKGVMVGSVKG
ncbi:MAG: carbohydrate ABC transporter permease [Lachnospiraceae bacterium]|nr:carbohydrate ABC transporter permease [Lachnospiraceae bacterium]